MVNVLETILAGVAGTVLMTLLMTFINHVGWANGDMIRALGSAVTRSYDNSFIQGLFIHFASGITFAFPYVFVIGGLGLQSLAAMIAIGGLIGVVHGFVMSFVLVAAVAEKHPLPQFQEAGFEVAAVHVVGHIVYGIGVGAVVALLSIDFGFRF